jgi:hypothetical protein
MEKTAQYSGEPVPIFDNFDIDLVVKVLSHTAFSKSCDSSSLMEDSDGVLLGPFFLFFLPIFFYSLGQKLNDTPVLVTSVYWALVSSFCAFSPKIIVTGMNLFQGLLKWYSRLYRNQGNLLFGPGSVDWGEQIVLITGGASQSPFTMRPSNHLHRSFWSWGATRKHFGSPQCHSCCP